ncbi:MAG: GWxTD domain-containing protein [Bacteroidia bacterium]|nr:GWxTD domain-containing protein [Bacteroidia bacterium]
MRHSLLTAILLSCLIAPGALGQPEQRLKYGQLLYAEVVPGLSDSAGVGRADLLLRVSYDFMVFERGKDAVTDAPFHGGVDVSVDLRRDGVSIGSMNFGASTAANGYSETDRRDQFLLLQRTLFLEAGEYSALIVVSDRGSTRESAINKSFSIRRFDAPALGTPIILEVDSMAGMSGAYGYAGYLPFARPAALAIPSEAGREGDWYIVLERRGRTREIVFEGQVQPTEVVRRKSLRRADGVVEDFRYTDCASCVGQFTLLAVPSESADTGPYTLRVISRSGESADTMTVDTEIFWRDMPYSMRDIDFAIEAMRHILTREQLKQMNDGDESYKRQQFRRFWSERDPTPGTAFNEMMAEYFIRCDDAYYKFQTLYEANGITTDRGKVYILFGAPEDTERIFRSGEPSIEIWSYPSLGKTFRFADSRQNGNYRLMED